MGYPCGPAKIDRARFPGFVLSSSLLRQASAISAGSVTCIICTARHAQQVRCLAAGKCTAVLISCLHRYGPCVCKCIDRRDCKRHTCWSRRRLLRVAPYFSLNLVFAPCLSGLFDSPVFPSMKESAGGPAYTQDQKRESGAPQACKKCQLPNYETILTYQTCVSPGIAFIFIQTKAAFMTRAMKIDNTITPAAIDIRTTRSDHMVPALDTPCRQVRTD